MPSVDSEILSSFEPLVSEWFRERYGQPTEIQEKAWSLIAAGEHCLISAATGSGKTLAAFLWGINQLVSGKWELGQTRLLYLSPLKALNNDIRLNLLTPLAELRERFEKAGLAWPEIRVMTRSGDTDQSDRRKMLRRPPEILITTPESLNLLLTSKDGQRALLGIRSVVLDEIHSVVSSKRGVYLMTAIERLAYLAGEFQRIALSATVRPMDTVAAFVGGACEGKLRSVQLAQSNAGKRYEIEVQFPDEKGNPGEDDDFWEPVVQDLKRLIAANRSTLIFVNSRMLSEKIAHRINLGEREPIAYSHHGSLSREIRFTVEQRLKNGELKAIVATNSLEMGIDVGALDCVVMVQSPNSISSAIQKVGRAGHQVGATSHAVVYPSHSRDFLEAAVLSESIREKDIESIVPVKGPLDVLAQVIVSILGTGTWQIDDIYQLVVRSYSYRELKREAFDLVLNMLAGRYEGSRLRELKARVALDVGKNTATLRKGALMAFYFSGGVIPDRGYYHLRLSGNGGRVGELDEEFVWEAKIGDVFTLGVQSWKIDRITHNDVFVVPAQSGEMAPPFWRAERYDRDFHFSCRIGAFLEWANEHLDTAGFVSELESRFSLTPAAATALHRFLSDQRSATRCDLPHRHHVLAEVIDAAAGGAPGLQLVLHTHWGGRVNRPYALALDAAWFETFGHRTDIYVNNDCVVVTLSDEVEVEEVLKLVGVKNVDTWLRKRLEDSGFFGARFREAAGIALLVTKNKPGQRLPLWLSRMRAKRLFESVRKYDDFPLLLETWRTCLKDDFDMGALHEVLGAVETGEIAVSVSRTSIASPFASDVAWRQINDEYMYATDQPTTGGESNLREDLVRAIAFDAESRPAISLGISEAFERKRQRLEVGYEPSDALELKEWLRDRIALRKSEWKALAPLVDGEAIPVESVSLGGEDWIHLAEEQKKVATLFCREPSDDLFVEWISYFGIVTENWVRKRFDRVEDAEWLAFLDSLVDERRIVRGRLAEGSELSYLCEAENFEILLRMKRARSRPQLDPLPSRRLPLFLARWQGLLHRAKGVEAVEAVADRFIGWNAGIEEWERGLLAARVERYHASLLDSAMLETGLQWAGRASGKVCFFWEEDLALLGSSESDLEEREREVMEILDTGGSYGFAKLQELLGVAAGELEAALWSMVWKGSVSNDTFAAARKGASSSFQLCQSSRSGETARSPSRLGRRARAPRVGTYPGNWYKLKASQEEDDALEALDRARERSRILLGRYGVVFKELLDREADGFRWRDVYKALRLLELSGEAVGGRFFEGVPGLQFASLEALRALRKPLPEQALFWLSATDPASVCGLGLEAFAGKLPKRMSANLLVYRGCDLVAESRRGGKALRFHVDASDGGLLAILGLLGEALGLSNGALGNLKIETINETDARASEYLESLESVWRLHATHKQVMVEGAR